MHISADKSIIILDGVLRSVAAATGGAELPQNVGLLVDPCAIESTAAAEGEGFCAVAIIIAVVAAAVVDGLTLRLSEYANAC